MSWKHLENVFKVSWRCLKDVLKMSWRRFSKTSWRRLEDVLETSWQDVLKTSWRDMTKTIILVLIKRSSEDVWVRQICSTSSEDKDKRRLQDVFRTSSSRRMFAGQLLPPYHSLLFSNNWSKHKSSYLQSASGCTSFLVSCFYTYILK